MHVQRQPRKTLIFELEFFAVFCALSMWADIVSPFAVVFIDNNGVKDALVRCGTTSVNAGPILKACLTLEDDRGLRVWYARVPTHSNIADAPSRLECKDLRSAGCKPVNADCNALYSHMLSLANGESCGHHVLAP